MRRDRRDFPVKIIDSEATDFCEVLNARWNPPYIHVLPPALLSNILGRLSMKEAKACFSTSKYLRTTMLDTLRWAPKNHLRMSNSGTDGIKTLPSEILTVIFADLDLDDLRSCRKTCYRWRQITQDMGHIWANNVKLCGSLRQIDQQWKTFLFLANGFKIESISMERGDEMNEEDYFDGEGLSWDECEISKTFPRDSLTAIDFVDTEMSSELSYEFWITLQDCTRLKKLHFCSDETTCKSDFEINKDSNLAKCKLEDFEIHFNQESYQESQFDRSDTTLLNILSEAKRICLDFNCDLSTIHKILSAAKDTLQEVYVEAEPNEPPDYAYDYNFWCNSGSNRGSSVTSDEEGQEQQDETRELSIVMKRLISYHGLLLRFKIEAPSLKILHLSALRNRDKKVLRLWCKQVETFSCNYFGLNRRRYRYEDKLLAKLDLPECRRFSLDPRGMMPDKLFSTLETITKLQSLTLVKDSIITPLHLSNFLQAHSKCDQPFDKLVLADLDEFSVQSILALQRLVPQLQYRTSQSWSSSRSRRERTPAENYRLRFPRNTDSF